MELDKVPEPHQQVYLAKVFFMAPKAPHHFSSPGPKVQFVRGADCEGSWGHQGKNWASTTRNEMKLNGRHQFSGVNHANGLTVTNLYGGDGFEKSIEDGPGPPTRMSTRGELARARRRWA